MAGSTKAAPRFVLIMGVSGCGKSTVASGLANALDGTFIEGDGFHPPANIEAMRAGRPLDDAMSQPWLTAVAKAAETAWQGDGRPVVIACSALKRRYRDLLRKHLPGLAPVHLHGSPDLLLQRMEARTGHFMPAKLLDSQIRDLEPPGPDEDAITVDIAQPPETIIASVLTRLFSIETGRS
jgi:gluconokinase